MTTSDCSRLISRLLTPLILGVSGVLALFGQPPVTRSFDVASIRISPGSRGMMGFRVLSAGRLTAEDVPLQFLITNAYGVNTNQIRGGPSWLESERYDITAKTGPGASANEMMPMLQALLEDRFGLKVHHGTEELHEFDLVAEKSGVKLTESKGSVFGGRGTCADIDPNAPPQPPVRGQAPVFACGRVIIGNSASGRFLDGGKVNMRELCRALSNVVGTSVIDKTGFLGTFDLHLEFTSEEGSGPAPVAAIGEPERTATSAPSIFSAVQQQLGLKLESKKGMTEVLVIDHVEKPGGN